MFISILLNNIATMKQTAKKAKMPRFDYAKLAKDILSHRETKDLSFTQLEAATGVKRHTWFRLEAAQHKADVETVFAVCQALGKPLISYFSKS